MLCEEFAVTKGLRTRRVALGPITFPFVQVNFAEYPFHALR